MNDTTTTLPSLHDTKSEGGLFVWFCLGSSIVTLLIFFFLVRDYYLRQRRQNSTNRDVSGAEPPPLDETARSLQIDGILKPVVVAKDDKDAATAARDRLPTDEESGSVSDENNNDDDDCSHATPNPCCDVGRNCCPICLHDENDDKELVQSEICHHRYHASCIRPWLLKNDDCPCCRTNQFGSPF